MASGVGRRPFSLDIRQNSVKFHNTFLLGLNMTEQNPTISQPQISDSEKIKKTISLRYYRGLNYISIYGFILVVYGGALLTDFALFQLMWALFKDDVTKYEWIAIGFDYARIGLAGLFLLNAIIHGIISTVSQIKLDLALAKEDESER